MLMRTGRHPAALVLRVNCCSVRTLALIQLLLARLEKLISVERARNKGPAADRGQAEGQAVQHATGMLRPQPSKNQCEP